MPVRFGEFVLDSERRQLLRGGEEIHMQPRALRFLEVLVDENPRAVSKKELMKKIWGDVVVEEGNLNTIASEVRAALGDGRWIRTVHRFGYAFAGGDGLEQPALSYRLDGDNFHVAIGQTAAVIGRDAKCDVRIDSHGVSRKHARITIRDRRIEVEDLGSKNGTYVGDTRITAPVELHDGDTVRFGDTALLFRTDEPGSTESLGHQAV